jgi:anti-sigma factor RsiW
LRLTRNRDPRPCEIEAPAAMNNASTSAHGTLARTGEAGDQIIPRSSGFYRVLAAALGQMGRTAEAKKALEKAIAIAAAQFDSLVRWRPPGLRPEDYAHMLEGLRKAGWPG